VCSTLCWRVMCSLLCVFCCVVVLYSLLYHVLCRVVILSCLALSIVCVCVLYNMSHYDSHTQENDPRDPRKAPKSQIKNTRRLEAKAVGEHLHHRVAVSNPIRSPMWWMPACQFKNKNNNRDMSHTYTTKNQNKTKQKKTQ
jgi:hypothetical protein